MTTPIFALTDWAAAQASPWEGHNAALRMLEALIRASVLDRDLDTPPGSCADGAAYLVADGGTGDWAGHDGEFAVAVGEDASNGWLFAIIANPGFILWVEDENERLEFREDTSPAGWIVFGTG